MMYCWKKTYMFHKVIWKTAVLIMVLAGNFRSPQVSLYPWYVNIHIRIPAASCPECSLGLHLIITDSLALSFSKKAENISELYEWYTVFVTGTFSFPGKNWIPFYRCYHDTVKERRMDSSFGSPCSGLLLNTRGPLAALGRWYEGKYK